jgi:MoaA/NifB/PqqE/SkfB family radical SAM enzyme
MATMRRISLLNGLSHLAINAAVRGADLSLQVPVLRGFFLDKLLQRLELAHEQCEEDPDKLTHDRWFAWHLRAFLDRLIEERPAAARAILRFIATWAQDVHRRAEAQRNGWVTPCTVVIEPTDRCNLHCPGCYAKSSCDGSDLPYQRMEEIVEQVIDMGVTLVTISGGEPLLREKADQTVSRLGRRFSNRGFLVYTNGTMIDGEIAERFGRLGNIFPAISVEGAEHQTDARRGRGVYQQTREARRLLARRGVMCGFSATVTRLNADAVCRDEFIEQRIEEGDLFGWFFLFQPIGRSPRPDLMVTAEQRAMLREAVNRWRGENRPIFLGDFWNDGPLVGGCIAGGTYYFHIYANGDISPCVFAPIACGNVFDIIHGRSEYSSLADFVQNHPTFRAFRQEQARITDRARPCLLIDHPQAIRRICAHHPWWPAKNMAGGYLDGDIARIVDEVADRWHRTAATLPPFFSPPPSAAQPVEQPDQLAAV